MIMRDLKRILRICMIARVRQHPLVITHLHFIFIEPLLVSVQLTVVHRSVNVSLAGITSVWHHFCCRSLLL